MRIAEHDLAAIRAFGYTEDEARFLYIVATHSGYFLSRQFVALTRIQWGKRSTKFAHKIESRGHACWREYADTGRVYHLFAKTLYSAIGKENLRNRRRHSVEFVKTRLVLLDFVTANHHYDYLETERQKVAFFCDQLGLPKNVLPAKAYQGAPGSEPTLRYFVDKYPLFFDVSRSSAPVVTFSFVDPGYASIKAFLTHLAAYEQLFRVLPEFRFVYIANSGANFTTAQQCFADRVALTVSGGSLDEILRYFRLRRAWEERKYALFSNREIGCLNDAAKRFRGERFDTLYSAWSSNRIDAETIRREFAAREPEPTIRFATCVVPGTAVPAGAEKEWSEVGFTPPLHQ